MSRALLALQAATLFTLTPGRRIVCVNPPDTAPPPRLYMSGCAEGWIGYLREDVDAVAACAFDDLIAREPPVTAPGATPAFAQEYRAIIGSEAPLTDHNCGPVYRLPRGRQWPCDAKIVAQGTPDGDALWVRLKRDGVPGAMVDAGFVDLTHFWEPWCVALVDDDIAAIAFGVRRGLLAAEIGVYTVESYRGRGLAAAVTAGWSCLLPRHPVLFYSTHRDNIASRRVIAKLRLPFLGESFRI